MEIFVSATEFRNRNKSQKINENLAQTRAVPALERLLKKRKRALSFMFGNIGHNFYYIWWFLKEPLVLAVNLRSKFTCCWCTWSQPSFLH